MVIEIEPRHSPRISCGQITSAAWRRQTAQGWNGGIEKSFQSHHRWYHRSPMWGDRKRGANIAVRLDRLGVSPREETTEFNSVNHPILAGLRDQRSRSSPRGVACSLCPPVAYFAILRITRCKRDGARVKEYLCRPTSGPNAVIERAWRPLFQTRQVPVYCSVGWRPEPSPAEAEPQVPSLSLEGRRYFSRD